MKNVILNGTLYKVTNNVFDSLLDYHKAYDNLIGTDLPELQPREIRLKAKAFKELVEKIETNLKGVFIHDALFY